MGNNQSVQRRGNNQSVERVGNNQSNAHVSDTRKTSNGCDVARRIAREDAEYCEPSKCVAAIDFGTTNCSVAYILPGEDTNPNMLCFHGSTYRVPTAILFNEKGAVKSFGFDAFKDYCDLDDDKLTEYAYFDRIKMNLHNKCISRKMKVRAKNGKEYYLVEVIAHMLKYLKEQLIKVLNRANYQLEATDIDWVITVPAIWKARGKQMMREAGYKAGLCSRESCLVLQEAYGYEPEPIEEKNPEKLSLALEPESASLYCHEKCKQQLTRYTEAEQYTYLIVDIGGGTVDMSLHQYRKLPQPHIIEAYPSSGNDYGGARVNDKFQEFLEDLVNDKHFKRFLSTSSDKVNAKNFSLLNQLLNENFEIKKVRFGDKEQGNGTLSIQLPCAFLNTYVHEIEESTAHRSDVELVEQELRISCKLMSSFFKPIKEGILEHIKDMLESKPDIKIIYLVGGFGGSKCIETAIQEHFNSKCIVPIEPAYAVVKGAVLQKQKPNAIKSRRADATYGVNICIPFINGLHNTKYHLNDDDGKSMCSSIFHTIVERGDIIESGYAFVCTFCPIKHNQTEMDLVFYSSEDKDIFYVTGEWGENSRKDEPAPVQELGKIVLQMPEMAGDKERKVDVTFIFSHTEIQVRAFDQTSKTEVKVVLDFLSSI